MAAETVYRPTNFLPLKTPVAAKVEVDGETRWVEGRIWGRAYTEPPRYDVMVGFAEVHADLPACAVRPIERMP
jgi:hypothetical protein